MKERQRRFDLDTEDLVQFCNLRGTRRLTAAEARVTSSDLFFSPDGGVWVSEVFSTKEVLALLGPSAGRPEGYWVKPSRQRGFFTLVIPEAPGRAEHEYEIEVSELGLRGLQLLLGALVRPAAAPLVPQHERWVPSEWQRARGPDDKWEGGGKVLRLAEHGKGQRAVEVDSADFF